MAVLEEVHRMFIENVRGISFEEALFAAGGHRSILGIVKHVAGWSAVYCSYAFEPDPRPWDETEWPRRLRDRIDPSESYLREILDWFEQVYERWSTSVDETTDLDHATPVHWGGTAPLRDVVIMVSSHWLYHAGEINAILAIRRGEAWEYGEEVEENHISTVGHRVRPPWMTDEEAARYEREYGLPARRT